MKEQVAKKKVLLIGASGFVGQALLHALLQQEDEFDITVLIHRTYIPELPPHIKVIQGNLLTLDYTFLQSSPPDIVFHLGRVNANRFKSIGRSFAALKGYWSNKRLVNHLNKVPQSVKLIYLSGSLMYGKGKDLTEDARIQPTSFAKQYLKAELPITQINPTSNIKTTIVRVPWVLGMGSWFKSFYHNPIKKTGMLRHYSPADFKMMFIGLEDCANTLVKIAMAKNQISILNLFQKPALPYETFMSLIQKAYHPREVQLYSKEEMNTDFEPAIFEAFHEEIILDTLHKEFQSKIDFKFQDSKMLLEAELSRFSKYE